jgi:hypothetical protein
VRIRTLPTTSARTKAQLVIRLLSNGSEIGRTVDTIELFRRPAAASAPRLGDVSLRSIGPELRKFLDEGNLFTNVTSGLVSHPGTKVVIVGPDDELDEQTMTVSVPGQGMTLIVLGPNKSLLKRFPDALLDVKQNVGEFADWTPVHATKLAENLQPMDVKWWARKDDSRAFVSSSDHRLKPNGSGRVLLQFIPAHSYIAANRVPEQYRSVLSEIRLGKGRVWICGLDLEASVNVDPAAAMFAENLFRAAADPNSTDHLPPMPTHEQLLAGQTPHARGNSPPASERTTGGNNNSPD